MKSLLFATLLLGLLSTTVAREPSDTLPDSLDVQINWDTSKDPEHDYDPNFNRCPSDGYDPKCGYDKYCPSEEDNSVVFLPEDERP